MLIIYSKDILEGKITINFDNKIKNIKKTNKNAQIQKMLLYN